jgi:hypothetical protein
VTDIHSSLVQSPTFSCSGLALGIRLCDISASISYHPPTPLPGRMNGGCRSESASYERDVLERYDVVPANETRRSQAQTRKTGEDVCPNKSDLYTGSPHEYKPSLEITPVQDCFRGERSSFQALTVLNPFEPLAAAENRLAVFRAGSATTTLSVLTPEYISRTINNVHPSNAEIIWSCVL